MSAELVVGRHLGDHLILAQSLASIVPAVAQAADVMRDAFAKGNHLYAIGNGGSAADAQHFTGELIGHYRRKRRPLPAVTIGTDAATSTCIANDFDFDAIFARQIQALARPGDVVAAFTTTGRSGNIVAALKESRRRGAVSVLFAGGDGGPAREFADHLLLVPSTSTPRIQEVHTLMLHAISDVLDEWAERP